MNISQHVSFPQQKKIIVVATLITVFISIYSTVHAQHYLLSRPDESVERTVISKDESRVVYAVWSAEQGPRVYSAATTGGDRILLFAPGSGYIHDLLITPDSQTVVIVGDHDKDLINDIFTVPITGGPFTQITSLALPHSRIMSKISQDSKWILYSQEDPDTLVGFKQLYSVPVSGGESILLSDHLPADHEIVGLYISPDSQRAVCHAAFPSNTGSGIYKTNQLYSIPLTGGNATLLAHRQDDAAGEWRMSLAITKNSSRVVYSTIKLQKLQRGVGPKTFDQSLEKEGLGYSIIVLDTGLYSVPVAGGPTLTVEEYGPADNLYIKDYFIISPDGSSVVYSVTNSNAIEIIYSISERADIYVADVINGQKTVLANDVHYFSGNLGPTIKMSSDSKTIVFFDIDTQGKFTLVASPLDGSSPVTLFDRVAQDASIEFNLTPDSQHVIVSYRPFSPPPLRIPSVLYAISIDSGNTTELWESTIRKLQLGPVSTKVVFKELENYRPVGLFCVDIDGKNKVQVNRAVQGYLNSSGFEYITADSIVIYGIENYQKRHVLYGVKLADLIGIVSSGPMHLLLDQ